MPLGSRREEIDRFLDGQADVCSPPMSSATASTSRARRCCSPRRRSSTARSGATCCRGSLRRSPAAPGGSASSSAATSACSPASWANADPEIVEAALKPHVPLRGAPRLPHRRRGAHPAAPRRLASRIRATSTRRCAPGTGVATRAWARELARRRVARPIRGRLARCSTGSRARPQPLARGHLEARQRAGRPGQRRAARVLALAVAGDRASGRCSSFCSIRPASATRRSRRRSTPAHGRHPPLVRAAVPGRRRRHDRAGGRAREGRGERVGAARGRGEPSRSAAAVPAADPRALVPALRSLLRHLPPLPPLPLSPPPSFPPPPLPPPPLPPPSRPPVVTGDGDRRDDQELRSCSGSSATNCPARPRRRTRARSRSPARPCKRSRFRPKSGARRSAGSGGRGRPPSRYPTTAMIREGPGDHVSSPYNCPEGKAHRNQADRGEPPRPARLRAARALRGGHRAQRHGGEVAPRRAGQLGQAFADVRDSEVWLIGAVIAEYARATSRTTSRTATASSCCTRGEIDVARTQGAREG